ncbi:MAG: hypothetical protein C0483_14605 [Pirellula sp.]|nr:hypothetical protein [Pirellula sp.]
MTTDLKTLWTSGETATTTSAAAMSPTRDDDLSLLGRLDGEFVLRITAGPQCGRLVRLSSAKCTIGSAPFCTLRLHGPEVQPVHCVILHGRGRSVVRRWSDATLLNDRTFDDLPLAAGDRLSVGPIELQVVELPGKKLQEALGAFKRFGKELQADRDRVGDLKGRLDLANRQGRRRLRAAVAKLRKYQMRLAEAEGRRRLQTEEQAQLSLERARLETLQREVQTRLEESDRRRGTLAAEEKLLLEQAERMRTLAKQSSQDREAAQEALAQRRAELAAAEARLQEQLASAAAQVANAQTEAARLQAVDADLTRRAAELEQQSQAHAERMARDAARICDLESREEQLTQALAELQQSRNEITGRTAELGALAAELTVREANIARMSTQQASTITARDQSAADREAALAREAADLERRRALLNEREQAWTGREEALARHDATRLAAERALVERSAEVEAGEQLLSKRNQELAAREQELQAQKQELQTQKQELQAQKQELLTQKQELAVQGQSLAAKRAAWEVEMQKAAEAAAAMVAASPETSASTDSATDALLETRRQEIEALAAELESRTVALQTQEAEVHAAAAAIAAQAAAAEERAAAAEARAAELAAQAELLDRRAGDVDAKSSQLAENAAKIAEQQNALAARRTEIEQRAAEAAERCEALKRHWNELIAREQVLDRRSEELATRPAIVDASPGPEAPKSELLAAEEPLMIEPSAAVPSLVESEDAASDDAGDMADEQDESRNESTSILGDDATDSSCEADETTLVAEEVEAEHEEEAEVVPSATSAGSESAADVLRRLGLAAVLDDDAPSAVPSQVSSPMPAPAPVAKPAPVPAAAAHGEHSEEDGLNDYMAQLFQRLGVRNSEMAANSTPPPSSSIGHISTPTRPTMAAPAPKPVEKAPQAPLQAAEFKARSVAAERTTDLSALRELCNVNARAAVANHQIKTSEKASRWKGFVAAGTGLISLAACGATLLGYPHALPVAVGGLATMLFFASKSLRLRSSAKKTTRSLDDVLQRSAAKLRDGAEKSND